jgi:hypothetical protein
LAGRAVFWFSDSLYTNAGAISVLEKNRFIVLKNYVSAISANSD